MKVGIVTNQRNSMMFSENLINANSTLGNQTYIFVLNYKVPIMQERERLLSFIKEHNINMLIFLNHFRFPNTEFFINENIIKYVECRLWIWDSIYEMKDIDNTINLYSKVYSIEIKDIDYLKNKYSIHAHYLPLFAGPEFYQNTRKILDNQDIDLFFIGTIAGSTKRLSVLECIAKHAYENGYKLIVLGRAWHSHHWHQRVIGKLKFRFKYPYLSKYIGNKVLLPNEVIQYYKRTKINLNIHIEGHTGYNCRTFEVLGNNNFLLSDRQDFCNLVLNENKHFVIYEDDLDLLNKIDYYLHNEDEREKIAMCGGALVREIYNLANALKILLN